MYVCLCEQMHSFSLENTWKYLLVFPHRSTCFSLYGTKNCYSILFSHQQYTSFSSLSTSSPHLGILFLTFLAGVLWYLLVSVCFSGN